MNNLDQLLAWDDGRRRQWLLESQPDDEAERTNWWLSIIQPLDTRVTGFNDLKGPERLGWAVLSAHVLDLALEVGALDDLEVANRFAYLAYAVSKFPGLPGVPTELTPDSVVRRSLGKIRLSRDDAVRMAKDWRDRPIGEIRALRTVKNLVNPLAYLVDRIHDESLRHEVEGWLAVKDRLP